MGVITPEYVMEKIYAILPISDSDLYNPQLSVVVKGAISKLRNEGVDINAKDKNGEYFFTDDDDCYLSDDYVLCIGYQVMKDIDFDSTATNYLTEQYITRVNTIRCSITARQR